MKKLFSGITILIACLLVLASDSQLVRVESSSTIQQNPDLPLIYIMVNATIYNDIKSSLDRYISDVARIGFNATVVLFNGGTPEEIRAILANAYSQEGLVGALLVGGIPWATFEIYQQINEFESLYQWFPIDLFYMDLDGIWEDTVNLNPLRIRREERNGRYEKHEGDRSPEIWIGRIKASNMSEDEVFLTKRYFEKNHAYRTGKLTLPKRALIYIDDDWIGLSGYVEYAIDKVYPWPNFETVWKRNVTTAEDYLQRLTEGWSFVHLMAHGSINGHGFKANGQWAAVTFEDIRLTDPKAFFYVLFSCQNANYDYNDYIGGWYIFTQTYGVAAIASTSVGGLRFEEDFYAPLKEKNLGDSFLNWLSKRVAKEDANPTWWYNFTWYYGMTILGDPTLRIEPDTTPKPGIDLAITKIISDRTILSNYTSARINVTVENQGGTTETFNVNLYANTSQIGSQTVTLIAGQSKILIFQWKPTIKYGNYTLEASAESLPGETDIEDNTLRWETMVTVTILGDVDGDKDVDMLDISEIANVFGTRKGDGTYEPNCDLNSDNLIDIRDLAAAGKQYGRKYL